MKSAAANLRLFHRNSSPLRRLTTSAPPTTSAAAAALTSEELKQIAAFIPRLCSSNHLKEAVRLISAAASASASAALLSFLPLPTLINRLALEPDLTLPMHLLNALKHSPTAGNLMPVATAFADGFFRNGRPKSAVKIFQWVSRPDFRGGVGEDSEFFGVLVDGFCRNGMVLEAVRVLRFVVSGDLVVGSEVRKCVYMGLLREARVKEALEVDAALGGCAQGSEGGGLSSKEVVDLLDRMIENWVE